MLHDMITNPWLWFSAAGIFAVFVGVLTAYSFYKLRPSRANSELTGKGWFDLPQFCGQVRSWDQGI